MATEGLIHGTDKWDPRVGPPFAAYGNAWIKQRLSRSERDADLIRLPQRAQAARGGIRRALPRAASDGLIATPLAIAQRVGVRSASSRQSCGRTCRSRRSTA